MTATFRCDRCHGTFPKEWSDADAAAESMEVFGEMPDGDSAVVCDGCFEKIVGFKSPLAVRRDLTSGQS